MRSALHATPSEEAWENLLGHFDALEGSPAEEVDRALAYATSHLERHWPAHLRTIPLRWITALQGLRDAGVKHVYYSAPAPHTERLVPLARRLVLNSQHKLMGAGDIEALRVLGHLSRLTQVDIASLSFSKKDALTLAGLINQGRISKLSLDRAFPSYRNNVSEDPSRAFFEALDPAPGQLEHLALVNLSLSVNDLTGFARKYELEGLKHLDLRNNILTDPMLEQLCRAPLAATLESLSLSDNFFSRDGLAILEDPDNLPSLKKLVVYELPLSQRVERALDARGVEVQRFEHPIAIRALVNKRGGLEREIYMPAIATIGRDRSSTIVLSDSAVTRQHAIFELEDGVVTLSEATSGSLYMDSACVTGKVEVLANNRIAIGQHIFSEVQPLPREE